MCEVFSATVICLHDKTWFVAISMNDPNQHISSLHFLKPKVLYKCIWTSRWRRKKFKRVKLNYLNEAGMLGIDKIFGQRSSLCSCWLTNRLTHLIEQKCISVCTTTMTVLLKVCINVIRKKNWSCVHTGHLMHVSECADCRFLNVLSIRWTHLTVAAWY